MRFNKIKYDGETVSLARVEQGGNDTDAIERTSTNEPNPEFKRAFTAFRRHVLDCAPFLAEIRNEIDVHTVHLKIDKGGRRSLQVSCSIALEACSGKTITITTPYMTEPADDQADPEGFLGGNILKMMDTIEACATAFHSGDHKGQIELVAEETPEKQNGKHPSKAERGVRGGEPSRVGEVLAASAAD
jgi:hypothetical protein